MPSKEFQEKLKYARTCLFARQPFYASLIVHANVQEREGSGDPQETAYTDGKSIFFFDTLVKNISREEFTGILMHEVMHIALAHVPRLKKSHYKPRVWNWATDYYINYVIRESVKDDNNGRGASIALPNWVLYDEQFAGWSSDEIYRHLLDNIPPELMDSPMFGGDPNGSGDEDGGDDRTPDLADFLPGYKTGANGETMDGDIQREAVSGEELEQAEQEWKQVISQAAQQAKMQGKLPGGLERIVQDILYPKVDWRILLNEFVQQFPLDYAWHMQDRRFADSQFVIPSLDGEQVELVVAVDTSGSFTPEQLKEAVTETYGLIAAFDYIDMTVLSCDTRVTAVTEVHSQNDLDKVKLLGGGGTKFEPVFEWIQENKPGTNGVIYFTDLMGSFPKNAPGFKALWIANGAPDRYKAMVPFGRVVDY